MAPEPEAGGGGVPDAWGEGGLVGEGRYRMTHRLGRGERRSAIASFCEMAGGFPVLLGDLGGDVAVSGAVP